MNDEIIKTRDEKGSDEFTRIAELQKRKSEQAEAAARLARRDPTAPEEEYLHLVRVVAQERPGHDAFFRAGHRWPSDPAGRLAFVTPRLLAALKAEMKLRVDEHPDSVGDGPFEKLDVPARDIDPSAQIVDEHRSIKAAIEIEKAKAETEALRAELAARRAGTWVESTEPKKPKKAEPEKA